MCEEHSCYACERGKCEICGVRLSVSRCYYCGRVVCRECSVELSPGIRVCKECYARLDEIRSANEEVELYEKWSRKVLTRLALYPSRSIGKR